MLRIANCSFALALFLGAMSSASAALVGYYPLNGNANEATGANTDLTLVGNAGFGASAHAGLGSALALDGDGDAAIGQNFVKFNTESASVVAWVYAESLDGDWNSIIKNWGQSGGGQFHLGLGNAAANTLQNHAAGITTVTDDATFLEDQWVHTAFVFDKPAAEHRLYINGQLAITAGTAAGSLGPGTATGLGIGVKPNDDGSDVAASAAGYWNGRIDEVGLYNEALPTAQIMQIYQNGLAGIQLNGTSVPEPWSVAGALVGGTAMFGGLVRRRCRTLKR
jgi:hypothetical protein